MVAKNYDRLQFRIWDEIKNGYWHTHEVESLTVFLLSHLSENKVIEQATGLNDNNGNSIYEGDIVRIFYDHFNGTFTEKEVVGPVKWECGTWVVNNSLLNHAPEYDETHLESAAVEVIGNIHENPELLESVTNCNQ